MSGPRDGLPVLLGSRRYEVDVESITWATLPPTRPGADQGAGAGEQSLSNESVWRRTRDNWILGAGQEYADLIEESTELRFDTSDGIDPWTARQLAPLPAVSVLDASANTNLQVLLASAAGTDYLVLVDGGTVSYCADPEAGSPTITAHTGGAGTYSSATTDGNRVWLANGSDIYLAVPGTAALSVFSTYDADLVGYANGRLLAANGNELVEVAGDGSTTAIHTHPNSAFVWDGIVASPGGIYVFGHAGDKTEIYVVTAIDTSGALDVPFVAGTLPDGEQLHAMSSYAGIMVLGTSRGLRLGLITGGGFLSVGPVIEDPGAVLCLEPQGEDVWFGWTVSASINGLGRARLSRLTAELVPSFAADLMARGTVSGDVLSVATFGSRRYFAISGRGFYRELATLEVSGTMDLGFFTYGISEPKGLDTVSVWTDALPSGCSVVVRVYADDETVTPLLTLTHDVDGATKATAAYTGSAEAERLRVTLTVTQSGATPVRIRRVTLRAVPRPHVAQVITLPLYLSDAVQASTGHQVGQDPYDEFTYLEALLATRERVALAIGDWTATVRLDGIEVQKGGLGGGNGLEGWADERRFLAGVWEVTMTTVETA